MKEVLLLVSAGRGFHRTRDGAWYFGGQPDGRGQKKFPYAHCLQHLKGGGRCELGLGSDPALTAQCLLPEQEPKHQGKLSDPHGSDGS